MNRLLLTTFLLLFGNCLLRAAPPGHPDNAWIETSATLPSELADKVITALLKDHLNYLWVGTSHGLVRRLPRPSFTRLYQVAINHHVLDNQKVKSLFQDRDKNLFIGTAQYGLFRWDARTDRYEKIAIPGNKISQITPLNDEQLLLAADASA